MAIITLLMGIILTAAGLGFYYGSESHAITALIPSFVGGPLAILGVLLLIIKSSCRKHVAHIAAMIAALGTLAGLGMGIPGLIRMAIGSEGVRPLAVYASSVLGVCCLVVMVTAICSFRAARKARQAAA